MKKFKKSMLVYSMCLVVVFGVFFTTKTTTNSPSEINKMYVEEVQVEETSNPVAMLPTSLLTKVADETFVLKDDAVALAGIRNQIASSEDKDNPNADMEVESKVEAEETADINAVKESTETSLPEAPDYEAGITDLVFNGEDIEWSSVPYDSDLYWLAKLINGEAEGEPYDGKIAVGNVVMNRVNSPKFPNSVKEVIFEKDQFSVVGGRLNLDPNQESINAAYAVLNGEVYPGLESNVLFFNTFGRWWSGVELWKHIGNHYFAVVV